MERSIEDILHENAVLKTKLWATRKKQHVTSYFILVDTKIKPRSEAELQRAKEYCDWYMQEFQQSLSTLITFNKPGHSWTTDYINDSVVKYVIEVGEGKLKKDGTRGKSGGTVHIHIYVIIKHQSNITLFWEALKDFFKPKILHDFGIENCFVSKPRLVSPNFVEEYMEKSFAKPKWNTIIN